MPHISRLLSLINPRIVMETKDTSHNKGSAGDYQGNARSQVKKVSVQYSTGGHGYF